MIIKTSSLVILIALNFVSPFEAIDFDRSLWLEKDIYRVFWNFNSSAIAFKIEVKATGWVGFGFSLNGRMKGSDVVLGFFKNDQKFFSARHAVGNFMPIINRHQNYNLLHSSRNETHLSFTFERKFDTCDKDYYVLSNDTVRLIYAWSNIVPTNENEVHRHDRRGSKSVNLFNKKKFDIKLTKDVTVWPVTMPNVSLPGDDTIYWCQYFKLPDSPKKRQYIGFDIIYSPGMEGVLHHLQVSQCNKGLDFEKELNKKGFDCVSFDMTDCLTLLLGWGIGAESQRLPPEIGIPVGEINGGSDFFLLSIHYNNVERRSDIIDSSGVKVYLTSEERPTRASALVLNSNWTYNLLIPPNMESFTVTNYCPFHCTKVLPDAGISVYSVLLHGHLSMIKIRVRHFRNGKELAVIAEDNAYDFNYQEPHQLIQEVKIMPSDSLMTECVYQSSKLQKPILGGPKTSDEMCFAILFYYPFANLSLCTSFAVSNGLANYFGVEQLESDNLHVSKPENMAGQSMQDIVTNHDWTKESEKRIQEMQAIQLGPKQGICTSSDGSVSNRFGVRYPGQKKKIDRTC